MYHDYLRGYDSLHDFAKGYKHICSPSPTKKVTSRGQGAGVKNKIQGAGPFLTEYLRMIFKGWPHRKKVASPGQSSTDRTWWDEFKNFVSTRAQIAKHMFFCWKYSCPCKRVQTHMFSFTNQKRWLQEAEAHVSKIKFKGLDLFWLNTCGWSSKVGPTGKKSHHQANHPQIGHDGTNSRILCQRAPKLQNICFLLKMHLSLQKGTTTYLQLHQPKKGDLKRPRRRCQK